MSLVFFSSIWPVPLLLSYKCTGSRIKKNEIDRVESCRLLMNAHSNSISETSKPKDAHIKSWKAHEPHSWVAKVEYYDDARMLVSCASDGQLAINDITKGDVLVSGFRHRGLPSSLLNFINILIFHPL